MATILVADDRPLNRQYLVTLLGYFGHLVVEASDGEEAWRLAQAEHPALVITDLVMPRMDGHELAIRMQSDLGLAKVPVIFYSASYSMGQAHRVADSVGAFGVLPKPCDAEELLRTVHRALGLPEILPGNSVAGISPTDFPMAATVPKGLADLESISDRLAAIIEMSLEMASEAEPERLLQVLAHMTRKLIGSKHAAVGLWSENQGAVWAFFSSGASEMDGAGALVGRIAEPRASAPPAGSVLGRLIEERRAQRVRNVEAEQLGMDVPVFQTGSHLESVLAVPLLFDGGLLGWMLLSEKLGAEEFSAEDERVACTLASEGAVAYKRLEDRRRAEENFRKSKAMFESLFESAPDALLASSRDGRITQVNAQAERMFGYGRGELAGQLIEILVPERFRQKHPAHRESYYAEPRLRPMGAGLELYGRRKDGTEFSIDIMLSTMQAEQGSLSLSVVRDISARREAEARVLELNRKLETHVKELQNANHSLESFSYSVSHDLRAPLRAIAGYSRMLAENYQASLDQEGQRLLGVIASNVVEMGQLIDDLLAFSRLSRAEMAQARVDMTALARSVVEELRASEPDRQVDVALSPMPCATGDRAMIRQAFTNLVSNAWKFTRNTPAAAIEIGSAVEDGQPVYHVKDNGAGFDMQYAHKLFGVFQRLHSSAQFEGTGIGLALVQQIVQRHGGRVWAESKVGCGATFRFTLVEQQEESAA